MTNSLGDNSEDYSLIISWNSINLFSSSLLSVYRPINTEVSLRWEANKWLRGEWQCISLSHRVGYRKSNVTRIWHFEYYADLNFIYCNYYNSYMLLLCPTFFVCWNHTLFDSKKSHYRRILSFSSESESLELFRQNVRSLKTTTLSKYKSLLKGKCGWRMQSSLESGHWTVIGR